MGDLKDFGLRLKTARMSKGLTQQKLAEKVGVATSTIGMYEAGKREPDRDTMEAITDILNIPMGYLMYGESTVSNADRDRLEALHQNPRLGMLFDRQMKMKSEDVDFMLAMAERIIQERDGKD